jgi:hypothetical protein
MQRFLPTVLVAGLAIAGLTSLSLAQDADGWIQLFNGKDLTGWKTHPSSPGEWSVVDGCIVGKGAKTSHLFSEKGDYTDFHYKIVAKISDKGNSGQYFRAEFMGGYPNGYEAQINSTFPSDPQRTGSLYSLAPIKEKLHEPDAWFTQEVIAQGNRIKILVNGKQVVDFVDEGTKKKDEGTKKKKAYTTGHFAIQQHPPATKGGPNSEITVKSIAVKLLPK